MTTKPNTTESENGFSEAPASWNTRYFHPCGFECQITLRGDNGTELLEKVDKAIQFLLQNDCQPYSSSRNGYSKPKASPNGKNENDSWCPIHECEMKRWERDGRVWYSRKVDGGWCKGK
jgi:hypothetical protein